jgi:hypothetical protein
MPAFIIFNPENLRPVDISFGPDGYAVAEELASALEGKGRHVPFLMFDDYTEDAYLYLGHDEPVQVNWFTRYASVRDQRNNYVPRHRATEEESALMILRYKLTGRYDRDYNLPH